MSWRSGSLPAVLWSLRPRPRRNRRSRCSAAFVSCTLLGQTADSARFSVRTEGDVREALFFAFAEARCPLVELRPRMASLEEVFLDLTDDDDEVAAQAAALFQRTEEKAGVRK